MKEVLDIIIYQSDEKTIDVRLASETIWLNLNQIAELFEKDKSVISRHIKNIFRSGELQREATVAKIATVQNEGGRKVTRQMDYYNLDVIIAVGYRVNSKKATQFRIWATKVLKDYLIKGYVINQRRITEQKLRQLEATITFIKDNIRTSAITDREAKGMLELIQRYINVWKWIEEYDTGQLQPKRTKPDRRIITYKEAQEAIKALKHFLMQQNLASDLFGVERDKGLLQSALASIYQTFDGQYLYPTFEEKAANLLYFIIKNHPFVDGNKRIGALLFLKFLDENLTTEQLLKRFNSNTLTAVCYLVASSPPDQKQQLINLIMNFIANEDF